MRDVWTEADVVALAAEEPENFDRKSGSLLDGDTNEFLNSLAKAASAFANSGGGALIIGQEDDGSFSGIDPTIGRTSMKDWIEQKLPTLVAYPLTLFRVHTVQPTEPSRIPAGRAVVVIEFGDSPAAPHQSTRDKKYYHRVGGRSEPAQHFYLELLRQRLTNPSLEFEPRKLTPVFAGLHEGSLYVEAKLRSSVRNVGRVAAYKWALAVSTISHETLGNERDLRRIIFPFFDEFPIRRSRNSRIRLDDTILPGLTMPHDLDIGFLLEEAERREGYIARAIENIICETTLGMQLATEMSPGELKSVALQDVCDVGAFTTFVLDADPWAQA